MEKSILRIQLFDRNRDKLIDTKWHIVRTPKEIEKLITDVEIETNQNNEDYAIGAAWTVKSCSYNVFTKEEFLNLTFKQLKGLTVADFINFTKQ